MGMCDIWYQFVTRVSNRPKPSTSLMAERQLIDEHKYLTYLMDDNGDL